MKYPAIIKRASNVSAVANAVTTILSVSKMMATETAATNAPTYRLALVLVKCDSSDWTTPAYLINVIVVVMIARNVIITVYVSVVQ